MLMFLSSSRGKCKLFLAKLALVTDGSVGVHVGAYPDGH